MTGSARIRGRITRVETEPISPGQRVDNSVSTLQKLFQLYTKSDLCDVQLQVGTHVFHAHKLILSMSSDVFKTMLTDSKWPDARKARIVLNEEPECVQVFGEFVQYMYTGGIHLSNVSVLPLLMLADKYNIFDLSKVCKDYMMTHCHASPCNLRAVSWLQYAHLSGDIDLETAARHYLELNFDNVMLSEDFLTMRFDSLEDLLKCEHLVIHSEYALFLGLKNWLLHNTGSGSVTKLKNHLSEKKITLQLMCNVRISLMTRGQLSALMFDPLVCKHSDFFMPKIQAAWNFQARQLQHCHKAVECKGHGDKTHCIGDHNHRIIAVSNGSLSVSGRNSHCNCSSCINGHSSLCSYHNGRNSSHLTFSNLECTCNKGKVNNSSFIRIGQTVSLGSNGNQNQCSSFLKSCATQNTLTSLYHSVVPCSSRGTSTYYTPRNYTCDDWSTCLVIENFATFPRYASHTSFFSTPMGAFPIVCLSAGNSYKDERLEEESDEHAVLEWQVELYPKGVRFPQAVMISIPTNYDISEHCQDVVRVAIISKTQHHQPCHVDISVLAVAAGMEDGTEYVEALAHKNCIFDSERNIHNIDGVVPFQDLNCPRSKYMTSVPAGAVTRNSFKVIIIIKPSLC